MCDTLAMYITNIEKEGPFLKIWGQVDKKAAIDVECALYKAYAMYEEGKHLLNPGNLLVGVLCCAKYIDEKYYRARITNIDTRCQGSVEVNFIDYGNKDLVPIANLRSMDCFNATFITLAPLALPFILSEVVCIGGDWNDINLEQIAREIRYMEVKYKVILTHLGFQIIQIYLADRDLAVHLTQNSMMQSIPLETQKTLLSKMIPRTPQAMPPADQSLLQYKSVTLEPNSRHEVYVSYITDGPSHFSVQLKKSESILVQLMREINSIPLKPFEELPIPGTVCLAKCVEDSHICRAVITSEVDNQYKLFYVDFGNTEIVPPDNLYQMPFKYIIPKIMAIRLSLDGVDKSTVTLEMQCAFKQFVDNRLLMMEVFPSTKKMALPKCRMWDPATNIDVMEILNKAAQLAFPTAIPLHRGFTRTVKVTFVYSCNKFYIHLKSNEDELSQLMANLQVYCNSTSSSFLEEPKIGQPCCAQFKHDGQWYRSSIVVLNGDSIKVQYIDYGNEDDVSMEFLKPIQGEFLTCMRPQAIECCLNGYQNMNEDLERDNKLEELILDQEFTMKVIDIINGRSLVDLIDSQGRSVTTLLMEAMINQTKIQVVANGNLESGPTKYGGGGGNKRTGKDIDQDRWQQRDKSQNRKETTEDWRQGPRKRNGSMSNETNESWRLKNNKNDTQWHDNTSNESSRKGRSHNENRKSANANLRYDGKYRNNRNEFRNHVNSWNSPEKDNHNSYSNTNNPTEWNGKEGGNDRNRYSRQNNEGFGNRENRNKPRNDNFGTDNSTRTWGENEEFQGVKKRTKNFSANNRNDRTDNEDWGNKKTYNGNDFRDKKPYRENKNSYDSDSSSYKKGKSSERSFDGKPRYDRGDNKKKPFRRDSNNHISDHEQTDGRKFNSRNNSNWNERNNSNKASHANSYNNAPTTPIDPAPDNATFQTLEVSGQQKVTLSWFHNPCMFFCQLVDSQPKFNALMDEMQEMYKDKPASFANEGAPAVTLFPEDNVFYRCRILKSNGSKYKVHYVDFGNISIVDSVWPIDKKFIEMPMQAIPCGLGGVRPVDESWPDPNAFVNYMQKDSLDCEFRGYEIDRYMVNLYSNGQEIKQLLVDSNLAKYVETSVPPAIVFEINFLAGHTFRAMLEIVNDLSDFMMTLSSGVQLFCSAHNLNTATELFVDELKEKIGQVVVVYCDNVVDDRLEVTLYDHLGNKINILNPDEGAFDTIESVCPYLLIQSKVEGFVSFVNETSVVIQPSECGGLIESLLNEIYEHYENLPQETPIIPEEGYLYAVLSEEDSNWYRGRVISFDDEKVNVSYIDYGNSESVPFANVRELDEKFYWWDRMAILVQVNVPTAELLEKQIKGIVHYEDIGLVGEITEVYPSNIPEGGQQTDPTNANLESDIPNQTVELPAAGEDTNDTTTPVSCEIQNTQDNVESFQEEKVPLEGPFVEGTAVTISHIDSPSDFYIQLAESQNAIAELQSKIQEQITDMPVLDNTSIGGLCAAPYSVDQMWYRSQILDADEDITTVRFIDYGNTDVIDNKATQIKTLPAEYLALEEYARRCRLKIKPQEEEWSKPSTDRFEELAYAENVSVQFISQDEKANYVELFSDGQNVKDILIAENLAVLEEGVILDAKLKGYISHMNSPSEFWVQLDGWCGELEWIAEQLSSATSFPDLEDFTPGSLCAAMFPDDEMWYRARILSNTVAGLEVLFLDYGNSCVCGNLKQLPEHLVMAPPLALKCSLQKPEGLLSWSPEAVQKFAELSADGQTEFTVKKLTTGETSLVELYANDEDVSLKLLPTTDDVFVTDIKSMDDFAASKDGTTVSDERYRLEKIPGCEYNEECLSKFVEINNEGKTCFGIEYLSDNNVRLYLNGSDIRNELLPIIKNQSHSAVLTCDATQSENLEISEADDAAETIENILLQEGDIPSIESTEDKSTRNGSQEIVEICETLLEEAMDEAIQENTSEIGENVLEVSQTGIPETQLTLQDEELIREHNSLCMDASESEGILQEETQIHETNQDCEIHEHTQDKVICDTPKLEENYNVDQGTIKSSDDSQANEIGDVSRNESQKDNELYIEPQKSSEIYETIAIEDNHEAIQGAIESCDDAQSNEIHDESHKDVTQPQGATQPAASQQDSSVMCEKTEHENTVEKQEAACEMPPVQENIEDKQEEAPKVCEILTVKEIVEEQASEICEMPTEIENVEEQETSELCEISAEKENAEQKVSEICVMSPEKKNVEEQEASEVCDITSEKEKLEEASEICEIPIEKENVKEQEASGICQVPTDKGNNGEQREATEICKIPTEKENNIIQEASVTCETQAEKEEHEVVSGICDTQQVNDSQEEQNREITKEIDNLQEESTKTGEIREHQEISQSCESVEEKQVIQEATEVCSSHQNEEINEEAHKNEGCDNKIDEDNVDVCDTSKLEAIESKVNFKSDGKISPNCDEEERKENITSQTTEIVEQEESCDIPQTQVSPNEESSRQCEVADKTEVTQSTPEVCDTQANDLVTEEFSKPCDNLTTAELAAEVCDIPKHILPIDSSEETEVPKSSQKLEFTETIMTSFSAPTVSEKESVPKLSPTKVTPKVQEISEDPVGDSSIP